MTGSVINRAFQSAVSMLAVVLLAACSDSKTTIIERAPVPVDLQPDDGPDHVHRPGIGRLLISGKDEPQVYVLDLQEEAIVADFTLDGTPTALYASDSGRYGIVVKGGDNGVVNFVDNGLAWRPHGSDAIRPDVVGAAFVRRSSCTCYPQREPYCGVL